MDIKTGGMIGSSKVSTSQINATFFIGRIPMTTYKPLVSPFNLSSTACFNNLEKLCSKSDQTYFCADGSTSLALLQTAIAMFGLTKSIYLNQPIATVLDGSITSGTTIVSHTSICKNYVQTSFKESFMIFPGAFPRLSINDTLKISKLNSVLLIEIEPDSATLSILQRSDSDIKYSCEYNINGELPLSEVPGNTYISPSRYNCNIFYSPPAIASKNTVEEINLPLISENLARNLDTVSLPPNCFKGIERLCFPSNSNNDFQCSNNTVSNLLTTKAFQNAVNFTNLKLGANGNLLIQGKLPAGASTWSRHTSVCKNNVETTWVETYEVLSTSLQVPNSNVGIAKLQVAPTFSAVSLLQVHIDSFSSSSVQHACYIVNGDSVSFQSVPGGIVGGYPTSPTTYDCSYFLPSVSTPTLKSNKTENSTMELQLEITPPFDINSAVGLPIEYTLASIYIVIAFIGIIRSAKVHLEQKQRSDFKSLINVSFMALFIIWFLET